jgi:RNA polymerase sigma factor (sigma-70 family)
MSDRNLHSSIRGVLRRLKVKEIKHLPDAELLNRYIASRDEAAFTALVSRHGPTVLSVCQRVLRGQDADDVFQATFLALAKDAGSIRRKEAIGAWLYEVAYHAALRAKSRRVRDQRVEQVAAVAEGSSPRDEAVYRDVQRVLDEELHQLPERLRQPLVLVHLLGHVQAEAARQLGITDRGLRKRLQTGRDRLRQGLSRRGVTLTAAALVAALDQPATAGPVAPGLLGPTVESVLAYAAGQTGAVPAATVSLAMAGAGGWLAGRFKLIALLAVPIIASLVFSASALNRTTDKGPIPEPKWPQDFDNVTTNFRPPNANQRTTVLTGQVLGADGQPVPHAAVTAMVRRPWQSAERGLHDEVVARGMADADGRFHLAVPADFPSWSADRRVTLLASGSGHAPVTGDVRLTTDPAPTELRMPGAVVASGRLVAANGKPAAGVRLAVIRLGKAVWDVPQGAAPPPPPPGWPAGVTTNADGTFRLEGLPAGENLWLQARDDRFALSTFRVVAGDAASNSVTLAEPRLLTGRVTAADTGRPLANARVAVVVGPNQHALDYYTTLATAPEIAAAIAPTEVNALTDGDGRYRVRLPAGAGYRVYVYAPEGAAYMGWQWSLTWAEGETTRERSAALPRGVEYRGEVVEEDGQPISSACVCWVSDVPEVGPSLPIAPSEKNLRASWNNSLVFSDTATLTGADGRFRIVLPASPTVLRVFGPTAQYQLCDYDYHRCPECGTEHLRHGEHARIRLDPKVSAQGSDAEAPEPIRVTLRRGLTVTGRAIGPDGEAISEGVLICRTVAQPLRKPAPRPLPIRQGQYELPGCIPGRTYPVVLLDTAKGNAAFAEFRMSDTASRVPPTGGNWRAPGPTIRLVQCGTVSVRLVDSAGRPIVGQRPIVTFWLPDDRPADLDTKGNGPWSNVIDASWVDPRHFLSGPVTDANGILTVPEIVPGLQYHISFAELGSKSVYTAPFRLAPGQSLRLPDVVAPPETNDEERAKPPSDNRGKTAEAPE